MKTYEALTESLSTLLHKKVVVDGHELEHVFYAAGGIGVGEDEDEGSGGGGLAFPLGAYYSDNGRLRFHPNPAVMVVLALPFVMIGASLARAIAKGHHGAA